MDDIEQKMRDRLKSDPLDLEVARALADHMLGRDEGMGEALQLLVEALTELRKVSEDEVQRLAEPKARAHAYQPAQYRKNHGDRFSEEEIQKMYEKAVAEIVKNQVRCLSRSQAFMTQAIRTSNRPGIMKGIDGARKNLHQLVDVQSWWKGVLSDSAEAKRALELLELALKAFRKKSPSDAREEKGVLERTVAILRKRFGDGTFTALQVSEAQFEAQTGSATKPGALTKRRARVNFGRETLPILFKIADFVDEGLPQTNSGNHWRLKPDAEKIASAAIPTMKELFSFRD